MADRLRKTPYNKLELDPLGNILSASRYTLVNVLGICYAIALMQGLDWIAIVYISAILIGSTLDDGIGDKDLELSAAAKWIYNLNLYATVPLLAIIMVLQLHHLTSADPFGLRALIQQFGFDMRPVIERDGWGTMIWMIMGTGYFYSLLGMTVAHELCHRSSKLDNIAGKILLAFNMNASFAIAHVHGHHRNVATYNDPGSARRNEYVLAFAVRSTVMQHVEAFEIEAKRLQRKELPVWSWHNRAIRDQLYPIALLVIAYAIAGIAGVIGVFLSGIVGSLLQKMIDYSQHYGLVRIEGKKVEERHSWECYRLLSNLIQFNLPLHAHHHRSARTPFWELEPNKGAPRLPIAYQSASLIALIPPLWKSIVNPILYEWDNNMANEEERALIRERGWEIEEGSWGKLPRWFVKYNKL